MKRKIQVVLGLLLGAGLVWLLFHDTDWAAVFESIRTASLVWLLLSQVPIWGSFFLRILRWRRIVRSVKPVSFRILFNATQIGFLANFLLPLRAGELIRAFLLARRASIPFSKSVALVALDRVTDLIGAAACMLVAVLAYRVPEAVVLPAGTLGNAEPLEVSARFVEGGAVGFAVTMAVLLGLLVLLYTNQTLVLRLVEGMLSPLSKGLARHGRRLLEQFADGLHVFRSTGDMAVAVAWSLATWGCFVLSAFCILEAFHFDCPWYTVFLMQTLLALAVSLPGAPGFVGQFHLAVVITLLMAAPHIPLTEAKAASIVMHLLNLIPVAIAGLISLALEQAGLFELTRRSAAAEATLQGETAVERAD